MSTALSRIPRRRVGTCHRDLNVEYASRNADDEFRFVDLSNWDEGKSVEGKDPGSSAERFRLHFPGLACDLRHTLEDRELTRFMPE